MSEREEKVETIKEHNEKLSDDELEKLSDDELAGLAGAHTISEPDDGPSDGANEPEEPETNEGDEDGDEITKADLKDRVEELEEKLAAQEEDEREDYVEAIKANSDWEEDELKEFDKEKLEKLADTVAPKINMKGKAQPRDYDDDEIEERDPVIANKSELDGE